MGLFIALCFLLGLSHAQNVYQGTVYYEQSTQSYTFKMGVMDKQGAAWGQFQDTLNQTGWGVLDAQTGGSFPDNIQMYAVGVLEGALTAPRIAQAYINMVSDMTPQLNNFIEQNMQWGRQQAAANGSDSYWRHIGHLYNQLDGLVEGYNAHTPGRALNTTEMLQLSLVTDFTVINNSLIPAAERPNWKNMNDKEFEELLQGFDRCSVLIKTLPDYSDIYFGHDTWTAYSDMNRIFKHYYLDLQDSAVKAKGHSFSSYPGVLFSIDDYYLTSAGLAVTETTNSIFDNAQYDYVNTQRLLTWLRVRAANTLADNGKDWSTLIQKFWSGTYPNQWMVLDMKLFTPGQPLKPDTFWVTEEIPSMCHAGDQTAFLARGHWPSYNIPFYPDIYAAAGYPPVVEEKGPVQSYDLAPRAKIFRRDVGTVKDLNSFKYILRYNDFQNDPFSEGNPHYSISSRKDLSPTDPVARGAIDTKITTWSMFSDMRTVAIAGPTTQGQPAFRWSSAFSDPHEGQPEVFNFNWVDIQPLFFKAGQ